MSLKFPIAARRMMRALSCCDNRQINDAVRRYARTLSDDELLGLLNASRAGLDPYHRAVLESLPHGEDANSGGGSPIKEVFGSFVAENPRALEQLPAEMIDGILQHAASDDPDLKRQFRPERLQRYLPIISGMAGSLVAAMAVIAYLHFSASQLNDVALAPLSLPLTTAAFKRPPALTSIRHAGKTHVGAASRPATRHPLRPLRIATSTHRMSLALTPKPAAHSSIWLPKITPHAANAKLVHRSALRTVVNLSSAVPRPPQSLNDTVAVDVNVVSETVESRDVEEYTQTTDSSPARYCYARGSWRAC